MGDEKLLNRMNADAQELLDLLPWGSLVFDTFAGDCACHVMALVAEVRRLKGENKRLKEQLDE